MAPETDRQLLDKLDQFSNESKAFADALAHYRHASNNTIINKVHAGGVGVWVATTCCLIMLALTVSGGVWLSDLSRRLDREQDYLNTIYRQLPQLKPKGEL